MAVRGALTRWTARTPMALHTIPVRSFASEHDPPLKIFGIPARYANATYVAASKQSKLDVVEKDLLAFAELLKTNGNLKNYLSNPTVDRAAKVTEMESMFGDAKTADITKNLMVTLAANNSIDKADKVAEAFSKLMKAKRGEVDAKITSAAALTKAQEKQVADVLKKAHGDVSVSFLVDSSILGGLVVEVGDKNLDMSVASKINLYTRALS